MTGPHARSATDLAKETGIPQPTLSRWLREAANVGATTGHAGGETLGKKRGSKSWTAAEKLRVLHALAGLDEAQVGELLRREGLHAERVAQWREEALQGLSASRAEKASASDRKRIRELERELARKEKALAEGAALLVLRKKLEALRWYEDDAPGDTREGKSSPPSRNGGDGGLDGEGRGGRGRSERPYAPEVDGTTGRR